jgi:hypothetical protein
LSSSFDRERLGLACPFACISTMAKLIPGQHWIYRFRNQRSMRHLYGIPRRCSVRLRTLRKHFCMSPLCLLQVAKLPTGRGQARRSAATPDARVCLQVLDELRLPRHKAALYSNAPDRK